MPPVADVSALETRSYAAEQVRGVDAKNRRITVVISTYDLDSHGTRIDQAGWDFSVFKKNPVIPLAHDSRGSTGSNGLPVAKGLPDTIRVEKQKTLMDIEFPPEGVFPLADTVFELARSGFINAVSVGFEPMEWDDEDEEDEAGESRTVRIFRKQRLLEVSIVTIPSNSNALIQRARKLDREGEVEAFRAMTRQVEDLAEQEMTQAEPLCWSRAFDVSKQSVPPALLEYEWVAKHIGCKVKEVFQNTFVIPPYRFGGFLSGLKLALAGTTLSDVRQLWGNNEVPPEYRVIELNSRQSDDFLVDGIAFYKNEGGEGNCAYSISPTWGGLRISVFTHRDARDFNKRIVDEAWRHATENNPLKGEAFSLSGEFVKKTDETWDDCFLEEKNSKALTRVVDRLNEKGKGTPNRGVLLMGPPGTGKTLSGRIIRNTLEGCSFVWVSSRDFHYGGFSQAFDIAREIAPSVVFFEDIDNYVSYNVDLLKTELDGIARSTGVVTIMTTNFPEKLPAALLDRPGRFHDVLNFDLPADDKRGAMLRKWVAGLSDADVESAVEKTKGYSGAHMYELASFARNLMEADGLGVSEALAEALAKVEQQKDLITKVQLRGSEYRPPRRLKMHAPAASGMLLRQMDEPQSYEPADVVKWKGYFDKKQPANRESTKVLEKFFRARGERQPDDELAAWKRMGGPALHFSAGVYSG